MKKLLMFVLSGMILLGISAIGGNYAEAAQLNVVIPTERAVYQRNEENVADLLVRVKYEADKNVTATLFDEGNQTLCDPTALTPAGEDGDLTIYEAALPNIPAGGWYRLLISAKDSDGKEEATESIDQVGVGEVFITAGQSNSCSFGATKTEAQEDRVSAFDPATDTWQHCTDPQPCISGYAKGNGEGSPWPSAGDALYAQLQVPIGFVTTGFGGSTIAELVDKHYAPIQDAIETLRPYGYRAILLHQGEGDSGNHTSTEDYAASLTELIEKTRDDAGYDLFWLIANAAYTPYTSLEDNNKILEAQKQVCDEETIFLGPLTDDMDKDSGYRRPQDNLHFNEEGLIEHGRRWAESIVAKLIPDYSQLPQESPEPTATPPVESIPTSTPASGATQSPAPTQPAGPTVTSTPAPAQPTATPGTEQKTSSNKGKVFKKGLFQYKITSDTKGRKQVKVTATTAKGKKSIRIPATVKYKGTTYQVTAIDKKVLTTLKKKNKLKKAAVPSGIAKQCRSVLKGIKITIIK